MNKDLIIILVLLSLMIAGTGMMTYFFILDDINECTRNPFSYGVKEVMSIIKTDYVYGTLYVNNTNFLITKNGLEKATK